MHDLDRTQAETEGQTYEFGPAEFGYEMAPDRTGEYTGELTGEYTGEFTGEYSGEYGESTNGAEWESPLSEALELEMAAELLEISSEEELDRFFGKLFRGVGRMVGRVIKSPVGRALGGMLKGVARKALPMVGGALGSMVVPGVGTALGSQLGSLAGRMFGLELEGLSAEDQEFEVARRFARFATAAAKQAAMAPPTAPPQVVAQQAVNAAAQKYAPGLVGAITAQGSVPAMAGRDRAQSGRWVRNGRNVMLIGIYR